MVILTVAARAVGLAQMLWTKSDSGNTILWISQIPSVIGDFSMKTLTFENPFNQHAVFDKNCEISSPRTCKFWKFLEKIYIVHINSNDFIIFCEPKLSSRLCRNLFWFLCISVLNMEWLNYPNIGHANWNQAIIYRYYFSYFDPNVLFFQTWGIYTF